MYECWCSVCLYLQLFVRYLYLFVYIGVQHMLCCVFILFFFILCTLCCQFFLDCPFWLPLWCSLTFIYLVFSMLPVFSGLSILIAPLVFSNVYLSCVPYVASFSGLSILIAPLVFSNVYLSCVFYVASFFWIVYFDCPFGIL